MISISFFCVYTHFYRVVHCSYWCSQHKKRDPDGVAFCLIYPFILRFRMFVKGRLLDELLAVHDHYTIVVLIYLNTEEVVTLVVVNSRSNYVLNT